MFNYFLHFYNIQAYNMLDEEYYEAIKIYNNEKPVCNFCDNITSLATIVYTSSDNIYYVIQLTKPDYYSVYTNRKYYHIHKY